MGRTMRGLLLAGASGLAVVAIVIWAQAPTADGSPDSAETLPQEPSGRAAEPGRTDPAGAIGRGGGETASGGAGRSEHPTARSAPGPRSRIGRTGPPAPGAAVFPDGTWLPPLNGVGFAPHPCPWPPDRPYSPVIAVITGDKGMQWYRHADGSHSTTQLVRRTEGNRTWTEPGWVVGTPAKELPVRIGPLPSEGSAAAGGKSGKSGR